MIFDKETCFTHQASTGVLYQQLTGAAVGTPGTDSSNILDMGTAGTPHQGRQMLYDKSKGMWLPLIVQVVGPGGVTDTGFAGSGATSVAITVQIDDNNSGYTVIYTSAAIAVATLVPGYRFPIDKLPPLTATQAASSRYIKLGFISVGTITPVTTTSTCSIVGAFVAGLQTNFS